jgi:2-methylcitrate dehydratase PrpD
MDASFALAKNAVITRYEDLPAEVAAITKVSILDTIGVMLAASTVGEGVKEMVELARECGGKEESTVIAFGGKLPAMMAAFANGAMGHPLDYDDTHDAAVIHPTAATLPAALAVSELYGKTSGKDFIAAIALGNDLVCRLGLAANSNPGWLIPQTLGVFGAAMVSAKLLHMNEEQMLNALGIAYHQAAGNMESSYQTGSMMRAIRDGFTAKAGVLSALMAHKGITGVKSIFQPRAGLYNLYFRGDYDPEPLTYGLGKKYECTNVSFKPWPARRDTHAYIEATTCIMRENSIAPEEVEAIMVIGDVQSLCEPLEARRKPTKAIDAKVSLPFNVALGAVHGKIVIADFLPENLKSQAVLEMARKVAYRQTTSRAAKGLGSGEVELQTHSGRVFSKKVDFAYGHPKNPISRADLITKFRDCVAYSIKPLSAAQVDGVISCVDNLETLDDISQIIYLIS